MSNVIDMATFERPPQRDSDGHDPEWEAFYGAVRAKQDRPTAIRLANSHVKELRKRDEKILDAVAAEMGL